MTKERQAIYEVVHNNGEEYGESLKRFISKLQKIYDELPPEKRENAIVDIDVEDNYGSPRVEFLIKTSRLETDEEYQKRMTQEEEWKQNRIKSAKALLAYLGE